MKSLILITLLFCGTVIAQEKNIGQFAVWRPKVGQESAFETGYKKHLGWHRSAGDKWSWYGWDVISGPRDGAFIDATFDHAWSDLDSPVNPDGDGADDALHVDPFGEFQYRFKVAQLKDLSISSADSLRSKYLRLLTLTVADPQNGTKLVSELREIYRTKHKVQTFIPFKIVDGGNLNQIIVAIGFSSWEEYGRSESVGQEIAEIEARLKLKIVESTTSDTLAFRADMSLFPE
jgi:hypothetical protein